MWTCEPVINVLHSKQYFKDVSKSPYAAMESKAVVLPGSQSRIYTGEEKKIFVVR